MSDPRTEAAVEAFRKVAGSDGDYDQEAMTVALAAADAVDPLQNAEAAVKAVQTFYDGMAAGIQETGRGLACRKCGGKGHWTETYGPPEMQGDIERMCARCEGRVRLGGVSIDPDHAVWWCERYGYTEGMDIALCQSTHDELDCGWRVLVAPDGGREQ